MKAFATGTFSQGFSKKAFVEGFGCSLNQAQTEAVKGFLKKHGFSFGQAAQADLLVINTCAVKEPTEFKMLRRVKQLLKQKKKNAVLIVFGCLPKINPEKVQALSDEIVLIGPDLKELGRLLGLEGECFAPGAETLRKNKFISIIPIALGCLGACSYCCVRQARGKLKSYPAQEIRKKLESDLKQGCKEFWLTAQDTGAYGFDLDSSLAELLTELLKAEGSYRIRLGMMNLPHLKKFWKKLVPLLKNEHVYQFLHLPLQSGSNKILKMMKRNYSRQEFLELVACLRKELPELALSTDIIVGFPGETEKDFLETVQAIEELKPDIVNISRFGARPNTEAALMPNQVSGKTKKARSKRLTELMEKIGLKKNRRFVGLEQEILVTERGRTGNFRGRTASYKPVIVKKDLRGMFARTRIKKAFPTYLEASVEKIF